MYSFEGEFRRKPTQSLGGASKQEQKSALLQRAQDARLQREELRKQTNSAITIQAFYRSVKTREKQKGLIRTLFDKSRHDIQTRKAVPSGGELTQLMHYLAFCFTQRMDEERLTWLCQTIIKQKQVLLLNLKKCMGSTIYLISNILSFCLRYLGQAVGSSQAIAIPMRMMEVFTDPTTYSNAQTDMPSEEILTRIFSFLLPRGYYRYLKIVIDAKVPSSIDKTTTPPTPVASSLFDLLTKPLCMPIAKSNQQIRGVATVSFCQEFFSGAYTEQVQNFILPALTHGQTVFPFAQLLHALSLVGKSSQSLKLPSLTNRKTQYKYELTPSLWLLHAFLTLADNYIEHLSSDEMLVYLGVLQDWIKHLSVDGDVAMDTDSDSEDDYNPDIEWNALQEECVALLNSPRHVKGVITCVLRDPSVPKLVGICKICHSLMSHLKCSVHNQRLLYSLAFNPVFIRSLWMACQKVSTLSATGSQSSLLQMLSHGLQMSEVDIHRIVPLVSTFCSLYSHTLVSLDDTQFYAQKVTPQSSTPFTISEVVVVSRNLRDACLGIVKLAYPDIRPTVREDLQKAFRSVGVAEDFMTSKELEQRQLLWAYLFKVSSNLVKQLYSRDTRKQYCPSDHWLASQVIIMADQPTQIYKSQDSLARRRFGELSTLNRRNLDEEGPPMSNTEARNLTILTHLPFVVSFQERVKIFQKLLSKDKEEYQSDMSSMGLGPAIRVLIRRNYIYEDAFDKLSLENEPNLRLRMQVQLVNVAGLDEAGIDGGGVFREFLSQLLKAGFDPNRGFFASTTDSLLYPNPQARILVDNFTQHYYFLGRMLGKALYENMLIELPFASFFLSKLLSYHAGDVDIHHLASMDPELYKNLMYLKNYEGDVRDLELDFTVVDNNFGETCVKELKPGGRQECVTNDNRIEYVHLVAHYKLNRQIRAHTVAFRQGLADVVNLDWLRLFDHHELQVLISGAQVSIDINDLKKHTNYSGGYGADHPVITVFWQVIESFTDEQKRQCLKFVTSCSRPPLLGFKDLYPAFCIHHGGRDVERLPTASTCMNLLKLPEFKDYETMRNKLLYAIESGAGFELS